MTLISLKIFRMFTKPYGALTEENFEVKIMRELEMAWLPDSQEETISITDTKVP